MLEFLSDYGLFLAKSITIVFSIILVAAFIAGMMRKSKEKIKDHIEVTKLNEKYQNMRLILRKTILEKKSFKKELKSEKESQKQEKKKQEAGETKKRVFVLNFKGDIKASAVNALREEITAVLSVAATDDEVVVKIQSGGGTVHGYGLAASQLQRIKDKKIHLTVSVDKIAASGGYLMACVADRLVSSPFAIIGSIGVVSELPNFHKYLKKRDIDYEQITAGEFKRTLTIFGENTEKARTKVTEQIEDTHTLFKKFVTDNREKLEMDKVATGEYWYGKHALELNLVDELITSDDLLLAKSEVANIFEVAYKTKKSLSEKISAAVYLTFNKLFFSIWETAEESRYK